MNNNNKTTISIFKMLKQKKLHNAVIFYGAKGIGKFTYVYALTKFILSHKITDFAMENMDFFNFDNIDSSTNLMDKKVHDRFYLLDENLNPDSKTDTITVDNVRQTNSFLSTAADNYYKIIIINTLELLNINAANALLKILEDTPKNTVFFIVCNSYSQALPTIKSRCIAFKLSGMDKQQMQAHIVDTNRYLEPEMLNTVLTLSAGSYEKSQWFLKDDNMQLYKNIISAIEDNDDHKVLQLRSSLDNHTNIDIIFAILENYAYSQINRFNVTKIKSLLQSLTANQGFRRTIYLDTFSVICNFIFTLQDILGGKNKPNKVD